MDNTIFPGIILYTSRHIKKDKQKKKIRDQDRGRIEGTVKKR